MEGIKMDVAKLGQRQLFGIKKENLMKRVSLYFEQKQHAAEVVEYLVAILVRHALCVSDFSLQPLNELIQQIFLTATPNNTLRRHCVYFQDFFSEDQWQSVIRRLFSNEEEYHEFTKETRLYKNLLAKKSRETSEKSDFQFDIVSTFKDANGKRHTWTLRDTKKIHSKEETAEVLKILSTLTIFQTSGVRRFAEYVKFKSKKSCIDTEHEAAQVEPKEVVAIKEEQPHKAKGQQEPMTITSTSSINESIQTDHAHLSNAPSKTSNPADQADVTKEAARFPFPGEMPPNELEDDPAKLHLAGTKNSPVQQSIPIPETGNTFNMYYGKSNEQIQQEREERKLAKKLKKILGRKKK